MGAPSSESVPSRSNFALPSLKNKLFPFALPFALVIPHGLNATSDLLGRQTQNPTWWANSLGQPQITYEVVQVRADVLEFKLLSRIGAENLVFVGYLRQETATSTCMEGYAGYPPLTQFRIVIALVITWLYVGLTSISGGWPVALGLIAFTGSLLALGLYFTRRRAKRYLHFLKQTLTESPGPQKENSARPA